MGVEGWQQILNLHAVIVVIHHVTTAALTVFVACCSQEVFQKFQKLLALGYIRTSGFAEQDFLNEYYKVTKKSVPSGSCTEHNMYNPWGDWSTVDGVVAPAFCHHGPASDQYASHNHPQCKHHKE